MSSFTRVRRLLFLEKDPFSSLSLYLTMPSEALLFLFAVIMAALLLFVMVFFVCCCPFYPLSFR